MDSSRKRGIRGILKRPGFAFLVGLVLGTVFVAPAGAHLIDDMDHLWFGHFQARAEHLPTVPLAPTINVLASVAGARGVPHVAMTIGADGLPMVAFYDPNGADLKVGKCLNGPCSMSTVNPVDTAGNVGQYPSIAIGTDSLPILSYYDATSGNLKAAHCGTPDCSSGNLTSIVEDSPNGPTGQYTSVGIGRDYPWIAYYDNTLKDLRISRCQSLTCSVHTEMTLDSLRDVGKYNSLAFDYGGFPFVSYYDASGGNLKTAKCSALDCSSADIRIPDGGGGDVGRYTSAAMDATGFPVISYFDVTNQDLKLLTCGNGFCGAANTVTAVDGSTGEDLGSYSSLAIGDDGFPVISYHSDDFGGLRVAKCRIQGCQTAKLANTLDERTGVGTFTAIVNAPDGKPVVAYFAAADTSVSVAKCANPLCLRRWWQRG